MTDYEALVEALSETLYAREPLAEAVMFYLNDIDPKARLAILNKFDAIVRSSLKNKMQDALDNEAASIAEL